MRLKSVRFAAALFTLAALATAVFGDELILIGDPGNPPDARNSDKVPGIGSVGYRYRIGKYEVTNAEYAAMLNAAAKDDPHALYFEKMGSDPFGGILREGEAGSYTYTTKAGMERKPIVFVRFDDAARYCNWLHNAQPVGAQGPATTEDGAYEIVPGKPPGRRKEGRSSSFPTRTNGTRPPTTTRTRVAPESAATGAIPPLRILRPRPSPPMQPIRIRRTTAAAAGSPMSAAIRNPPARMAPSTWPAM